MKNAMTGRFGGFMEERMNKKTTTTRSWTTALQDDGWRKDFIFCVVFGLVKHRGVVIVFFFDKF